MSRRLSAFNSSGIQSVKYFAVISCFFICGAVVGVTSASAVSQASASVAIGYILGGKSFFSIFFSVFKYHFAVSLLGLMLFGFILIPVVSGVKGFFLSFVSSCFVVAVGNSPFSPVFLVFFVSQLISVVLLFFLMNAAMAMSARLTGSFLSGGLILKKFFRSGFLKPVLFSAAALFIVSFAVFFISARFDFFS